MTENTSSQFLESIQQQRSKLQRDLKEVDMLIQQTTSEVDRLVRKNSQAAALVRQIDVQIDIAPREDIQSAYQGLIESQRRLFTMRGQLEKLQSGQQYKTSLLNNYNEILKRTDSLDAASGEEEQEQPSEKALVISVIEAQERERQRLSRQMHDGPAQSLTNLVLQAEICERLFDVDRDRAKVELAELKADVISTFQKVKKFIFSLRPMMLDDLGLTPTLRRYVAGLKESGLIPITLQISGKEQRLASYKEVTIFRVVQELHHIASRYGNASTVKVDLEMDEKQVRVTVEGDGSSFELGNTDTLATAEAKRLGLPTLRERIEMLEGKISFETEGEQGLRTTFTLPIEEGGENLSR
ncbi:MAG TPA: sensor histidine kinase [Thermoflexia bacterium]|nr:sensor histidine kinase [Thermoflexia bacterium]